MRVLPAILDSPVERGHDEEEENTEKAREKASDSERCRRPAARRRAAESGTKKTKKHETRMRCGSQRLQSRVHDRSFLKKYSAKELAAACTRLNLTLAKHVGYDVSECQTLGFLIIITSRLPTSARMG